METDNAHEYDEEMMKLLSYGYRGQSKLVKVISRSVFKSNDQVLAMFDSIDVEEKVNLDINP